MTRKQFEEWVKRICQKAGAEEEQDRIEIIISGYTRKVIVVDLDTAETGMSDRRDATAFDDDTGIAIAYARLRGEEVPKIVEKTELEFRRAKNGDVYYIIDTYNRDGIISEQTENGDKYDNIRAKVGNYFLTRERAEEVLNKIKMLLFLEKMHDTYCPWYKPDWSDNSDQKFQVSTFKSRPFNASWCTLQQNPTGVYFSSHEIAKKSRRYSQRHCHRLISQS